MSEHAEDPVVEGTADDPVVDPVVVEEHIEHPVVAERAEHPVVAERGAVALASREHDVEVFDHLDKGFSKAVLFGYITGVVANVTRLRPSPSGSSRAIGMLPTAIWSAGTTAERSNVAL